MSTFFHPACWTSAVAIGDDGRRLERGPGGEYYRRVGGELLPYTGTVRGVRKRHGREKTRDMLRQHTKKLGQVTTERMRSHQLATWSY